MTTKTIYRGVEYICYWKRGETWEHRSGIFSIKLNKINGKKVMEHWTEGDMDNIAGPLADDKCKLKPKIRNTTKVMCSI